MRYFFFALLFAIMSCSGEQNSSNNIDSNANISDENKHNWDEVYYHGEIALLKKNNLPLTGFVLFYNQDGGLSCEKYYINGRQEGKGYFYYQDGSWKREANYKNGEMDGFESGWYQNGRKSYKRHYINGNLDGEQIEWYENGQLNEISNYNNGLRAGWQRAYLENGNTLYEVNLINGNGKITYNSPNSNAVINKEFILGVEVKPINGSKVLKYENPLDLPEYESKTASRHRNGLKHGKDYWTHENGQKSFEGEYFFDQEDGIHQSWYENGKLKEIKKYNKGILMSAKCWDESGKEMECDCYDNSGKKIKCP